MTKSLAVAIFLVGTISDEVASLRAFLASDFVHVGRLLIVSIISIINWREPRVR
jgi:hypothetical protein